MWVARGRVWGRTPSVGVGNLRPLDPVVRTRCKATRRAATEAEKRAHKQTRQGTCYWVSVVISAEAQVQALGGAPRPAPSAIKREDGEDGGVGHVPAAGGKKRKAAVPCQKATERKFCGAWKAAEEAQLQQLVHALGEGVVWEDVASRLGTGRSGSAVREHWAEHRKRRKAADELQAKLREEADEERAEAASAAPRVALKLPWPPQAGAAAAVVPQDVTDLTLTSPMRSCVLSDGPPLPPTTLPPLPPTLRRLRLVHAAAHLSEEGWAAISGCISLRELDIDWGGDELARLDTPPPDLRTLRLTHVDYARGSSRPPPAFFERLGARRTLRTLVVSGSCDLPAACLHALRGCPLRELVLEGGRDDGYALAHPHAAALPTLVALAPGLRTLELTGTDLSKREAAALNNRLPPGCSATHFPPPKKDFEPYYEWAQRQQEAEEAGAPRTSGRISPQYDKYGYSGWGNYRRRHDFSRSTSHREEHGIYGLEPFDRAAPDFQEEWW